MTDSVIPTDEPEELDELRSLDPEEVEELVADLWRKKGWDIRLTEGSGDKGVDVAASKGSTTHVIQVKRYAKDRKIERPDMDQYFSLMRDDEVDTVWIVTTSSLTMGAENFGFKHDMEWLDGEELVKELREFDLLSDQGEISEEPDRGRPTERVESRPKTTIQGESTAVIGALTVTLIGIGMMVVGSQGSTLSEAGAIGLFVGMFGVPITIGMDIRVLNKHDANYKPSYLWVAGAFLTVGLIGLWYLIRRLLRTDLKAAFGE